jgi:hypothetical protein
VDLDRLAEVNARLTRAREEYRAALIAEHETEQLSFRSVPLSEEARKPIQRAHERSRRAAEEYEQALADFIKFKSA